MTEAIKRIIPFSGPVSGEFTPPGSKSISNRVQLLAALADGTSVVRNLLASDDTQVMLDALTILGTHIESQNSLETVSIRGGLKPNTERVIDLFVGNSGTTIRFLTAALAIVGGNYRLHGVERMHQRPIGDLADALVQLGCEVRCEDDNGCPPVVIASSGCSGGTCQIAGEASSQFLSGLLMAAPLASGPVTIEVSGQLVSKPYVRMTLQLMYQFGVSVQADEDLRRFVIHPAKYQSCNCSIEPDASSASYFFALAAICGGSVTIKGLGSNSLQGDLGFVDILKRMGCAITVSANETTVTGPAKIGVDVDMSEISDTAQTAAAVALFVGGPTTIRGIAHNRVKETDRIGNLLHEIQKLGVKTEELEDGFRIYPGPMTAARFQTYDDHRMAMSLSLIGLRVAGIEIENPECVSKTYASFFEDMDRFLNR
ncbi:MAG: 3-phosphoshikimate 1-carboxyvinyltransferase [Pirellulaceae bacterium]